MSAHFTDMAKLFLHIGDHKTGTSAIQRALAGADLPSGWLYPIAGRAMGAGHHNLPWELAGAKRFRPGKGGWSAVAREIAAATPAHVILSSEAFEFQDPERTAQRLETAFAGLIDEVEALLYLRPHAPRLISSFAERVKRGVAPFDRKGFLDLMLNGQADYAPRIRAWRKAFDERNWTIKPKVYEADRLKDGDAVSDFADAIGLRALRAVDAGPSNASPSAPALRMIQIYAQAVLRAQGPAAARQAARVIAKGAAASYGERSSRPRWRRSEAERIRDALRADAVEVDDLLAREYGLVADFTAALDTSVATALDETSQDLPPEAEIAAMIVSEAAASPTAPRKRRKSAETPVGEKRAPAPDPAPSLRSAA